MSRRYEYGESDPKPRGDGVMGGAMPRWFSVILLALLTYFGKRYADSVDMTLREHASRLQAVELWRANMEGRAK